jgi:ubiquinone/menaquinone biosynthesis C-methylase UbiE
VDQRFARIGGRIAVGVGLAVATGLWWRKYTTPFPYSLRWMLNEEFPGLSQERLLAILAPDPGEAILEVGPGTGLFSIPVATAIGPNGSLTVVDIQQAMLDHTIASAREHGLENIEAVRCDASRLPFPDEHFDGAFLVTALGEIGDYRCALSEFERVLKPGARLVVGEFLIDWHAVRLNTLKRRAAAAGLLFTESLSTRVSYLARLERPVGRADVTVSNR